MVPDTRPVARFRDISRSGVSTVNSTVSEYVMNPGTLYVTVYTLFIGSSSSRNVPARLMSVNDVVDLVVVDPSVAVIVTAGSATEAVDGV